MQVILVQATDKEGTRLENISAYYVHTTDQFDLTLSLKGQFLAVSVFAAKFCVGEQWDMHLVGTGKKILNSFQMLMMFSQY